MRLAVGFGSEPMRPVQVIVTLPEASRPSMSVPRAAVTATTGMVIGGVPATVAARKPATLLYSTTPTAPAL
jgi:hypothetical protein